MCCALPMQGVLGRFAAAIKLGRVQQAAAEARLAQRLAPDDARGAVAVSLACMAGEDMGQALRSLKRAREADPSYPGADKTRLGGISLLTQENRKKGCGKEWVAVQ